MNSYDEALRQFNQAADLMGMDPDVRKILSDTATEVTVNFPVKMDDGEIQMVAGFIVQHNNILGPFAGGLRYHPSVDMDNVRAMAIRMTWKRAMCGLPFGGAMAAVQIDPRRHSLDEIERTTRRFTFCLGGNIGPEYHVMSPEVNTNPQIMAWILDTYLSTVPPHERNRCRHVVVGKPLALGGCAGRERAAGLGLVTVLEQWARGAGLDLSSSTFAVQGFGNVGSWTAILLHRLGARLLAVEDASGALANLDGIDPEDLQRHTREHGLIQGYEKASPVSHEAFLATPAHIFIPAALQNQITRDTAPLIQAKVVAEGANFPTDREGEAILLAKGAAILPDLLCNAGGITAYYFEWLQNRRAETWEASEVEERIRREMVASYERVCSASREYGTDLRTAALVVALSRLENAYMKRGIFP
jgi:glutamate dehydrogenase (NAD(P)+)